MSLNENSCELGIELPNFRNNHPQGETHTEKRGLTLKSIAFYPNDAEVELFGSG